MDEKSKKQSLSDKHWQHREDNWSTQHMQHWRAWGSWFSWGSPVGLGLFYALIVISSGIFLWLKHH